MCPASLSVVLLAIFPTAHARTNALVDGTSPNRQFRVQVSQSRSALMTYRIVRTSDSAILHRVMSSYQPEEGEMPDWAWSHASDAEIHWSDDSHYLVIDEQVHNYIGKVFIISVTPQHAETVAFPEKEILACTKLNWDRHRVRVGGGWSSGHHLSVSLAGQVRSGTLVDGRAIFEHRVFEIELQVRHRTATVTSCGVAR